MIPDKIESTEVGKNHKVFSASGELLHHRLVKDSEVLKHDHPPPSAYNKNPRPLEWSFDDESSMSKRSS